MAYEFVLYEKKDHIAYVTINRPDARNALDLKTREELLAIVKKMIGRHSIDALILGCTELPLILTKDAFGIPFLNTTAIHAESIVNFCIGKET